MSIPFSDYDNAGIVANPAVTIADGLLGMGGAGWPVGTAMNVVASAAAPAGAGGYPGALGGQMTYIANEWRDLLEAERRLQIDAFVQAIMEPMAPLAPGGLPARTVAEQTIALAGVGGVVGAGAQVGHGRLDYLISNIMPGLANNNRLRPSVIIEAKANIGGGGMNGHWQMCAELATAKQLAGVTRNTRGVLTDGQRWKFYELESGAGMVGGPIYRHTAVLDYGVVANRQTIIDWLFAYLTNYAAAPALL